MIHRAFYIVCVIAVLTFAGCSTPSSQTEQQTVSVATLIGQWKGTDSNGDTGEMHFFPDGRMLLVIGKIKIGDPAMSPRFNVRYSVDAGQSPWHLDVVLMRDGNEMVLFRGLVEVLDQSTIRVGFDATSETGFGDTRPSGFSSLSAESVLILRRQASMAPEPTRGAGFGASSYGSRSSGRPRRS